MDFAMLYDKAIAVARPRTLSDSATSGGVGASLFTKSGHVYTGVCIDAACSVGFCAEHAAAATMITAGENIVKKMIAVRSTGEIIPPCGRCREFVSQLSVENKQTKVMVSANEVIDLEALLPFDWRKMILEEARILFIHKGFQAVTMSDIVEACNISRGGLYRYFKNTTDIFISVLQTAHESSDLSLKQAMKEERPALDILDQFFVEQKNDFKEQSLTIAIYEFFFQHKDHLKDNMLQEQFNNAEAILSAFIQYGINRGEFNCVDPRTMARHIILLLEGVRVSSEVVSVNENMLDEQFDLIKVLLSK